MTVRELIELLEKLPDDQKDFEVTCSAEAGCTVVSILGIDEVREREVMLYGY